MQDILPEEGESKAIGRKAVAAIKSQAPESWILLETDGDTDFGVDAWVNVIAEGKLAETFFAQFKGTTRPQYIAGGQFLSHQLRVATLNYLRRLTHPVMLVVTDLVSGSGPSDRSIYYRWIHDDLDSLLSGIPVDATKDTLVTIRIPTSTRLSPAIDVTPMLAKHREDALQLQTLSDAIAGTSAAPSPEVAVAQLTTNVRSKGASFVESTTITSDTPWADPKAGTIAWSLKQLSDRIGDGATDAARVLLERIDVLALRDDVERAEFAYLRGSFARMNGETAKTQEYFAEANRILPNTPRYFSAWIEEQLVRQLTDTTVVERLLVEVTSSKCADAPLVSAIHARILSILGRKVEAHAALEGVPRRIAAIEIAVLGLVENDYEAVQSIAAEGPTLDMSRNSLLTLRILAARARFGAVFRTDRQGEVPLTGPANLDGAGLQSLWSELEVLASELLSAGWPSNSEYVIDLLAAVGCAADKAAEALSYIESLTRARPHFLEIQVARMKLAMVANRLEVAIDAAGRLEPEAARIMNLMFIHYQAGNHRKVVDLTPKLMSLDRTKHEQLPDAIVVAAHSAHKIFNKALEDACIAMLTDWGSTDRIAVLKLMASERADKEKKAAARREFIDAYRADRNSTVLQDHLFRVARVSEEAEAQTIVEASQNIAMRRQLQKEEVIATSQALSTLHRVNDALGLISEARSKFGDDAELLAVEALILERSGDSIRAREISRAIIDRSELARNLYINIAVRSGQLDEAVAQLESVLGTSTDKEKRAATLRALLTVELYRDVAPSRLINLLIALGEIVDRESEDDEGVFLQLCFAVGLRAERELEDTQRREIDSRLQEFVRRFPNSSILGRIQVPDSSDPRAVERALRARLGGSAEADAELDRIRNLVKNGEGMVPYAWRPRLLVPSARTVPQLWELTKRVGRGNLLLSFPMTQQVYPLKDLRRERRVPVLDLLTLLILADLDLWEVLFKIFDRIAIPKGTLLRIQHDDGPLSAPSESLTRLRGRIREKIEHIEQPGEDDPEEIGARDGGLEEIKGVLLHPGYMFYSDDVIARAYALGDQESERGTNTSELLRVAEQSDAIDHVAVPKKIAQLIKWNIGAVLLEDRHLMWALPAEFGSAQSLKAKIQVLFECETYQVLVSGIWDPPKPYIETLDHVSGLLAFCIQYNPGIDERSVAAVWASWLDKEVLRPDIPLSVEEHLASVLIRAAFKLRDTDNGARILWNSYIALVDRFHGIRMDESVEKKARELVGRMVAKLVGSNDAVYQKADELLGAVKKGLTAKTADEDSLMRGYYEARAESYQHAKRN